VEILCILAGALALVCALALTPLARALALRIGFVDVPGPRKIHTEPMAYGGGLALAAGLALALVAVSWSVQQLRGNPAWREWNEWIALGRLNLDLLQLRTLAVCLAGAFGVLLLGLADDRFALSPGMKITFQLVLAVAAVSGGVRITALVGDNLFMHIATVLWIVLITNSFNLLDNMDGLCSGTAAIAAGVLSIVAIESGDAPSALLLAALSGACLGFLKWNLAPARIFLGDAGSQGLGFLLATLSASTTYYTYQESVLSVGIPLLIFAIPLYDTASVFWIRFSEGRALFKGDNSHFSHRLVDLGMSRRQAVATIHLAALAIALPAAVIPRLDTAAGLLLASQALLILTLIALLEYAGRQHAGKQGRDHERP